MDYANLLQQLTILVLAAFVGFEVISKVPATLFARRCRWWSTIARGRLMPAPKRRFDIERVIALVPGVQECAVVAQKHRMLDEIPVAFVIPVEGTPVEGNNELPQRIVAECKAKLADFKVPREVIVVPEMPRSTLEKIAKAELRKRLPVVG